MKHYSISGDKDGNKEFNFSSNNKTKLIQLGKNYSQKGYFVFLVDNRNMEFTEIRHNETVLYVQEDNG